MELLWRSANRAWGLSCSVSRCCNPADPANCWWVPLTRARHEARARDLFERRIAYHLPLVRRRIRYRRKSVTRYLPLFPSYLFLHGSDEDRVKALATNRLSGILGVNNPLQLERDLLQLRRLISPSASDPRKPVLPRESRANQGRSFGGNRGNRVETAERNATSRQRLLSATGGVHRDRRLRRRDDSLTQFLPGAPSLVRRNFSLTSAVTTCNFGRGGLF